MVDAWASQAVNREQNRVWVQETQQGFDPRHRTVGAMAKATSTYPTLQFRGFMHPINAPMSPQAQKVASSGGVLSDLLAPVVNTITSPNPGQYQSWAGSGGQKTTGSVEFLYNPASIAISYAANPNMLPGATIDPSQLGQPTGNNGPTITFSLLFDRTYEVMGGSSYGVLTDIMALERMSGMTEDSPIPVPAPIKVGFSNHFIFSAVMQSFNVEYTHFSNWMTPMRCGVQVTVQRVSSKITANQNQIDEYNEDKQDKDKTPDLPQAATPKAEAPAETSTTGTTRPSNNPASNNAWVNAVTP